MDRRSLLDDDEMPEERHDDVFGDEHEAEDFDFVADGFAPSGIRESQPQTRHLDVRRGPSMHDAPTRQASIGSRNSLRKPQNLQDPFASVEDVEEPYAANRPRLDFEPDAQDVRRSVSSASSAMYARTHSPRFGVSATPSHPYNMYPQGTVQRSSSGVTTSTIRQQDRILAPQPQPQHPYAMYPQGVDDDLDPLDDEGDLIQQNPVTVGFTGLGNNYRRRMGPDGEEQDIIGEDGHTEQLPPYSRYPEDGPEKMPLLVPTVPTALHSRAPVAGTDPAMPLMHASLQPSREQESMTDESALDRPLSMASLALLPTHSSHTSSDMSAKKSWNEKSWKEKRRTRICGIPVTWYLVLLFTIGFVAAIIGGIAGGYLAGRRQNETSNPASVSVVTVFSSLYDASIIASPTAGAPATGTFALALSTPTETQSECLATANQGVAWSCDLVPNNEMAINVTVENDALGANLFFASNDTTIMYGAQASDIDTTFAQFLTVMDNNAPGNGPAYYFQQTYNKVVVVPEDAFDPSSRKLRREATPGSVHGEAVPPGSFPWFCVWNQTFLEAFIFIEQPMVPSSSLSSSVITSTSSSASPSSTTSTSTTGSPPFTGFPGTATAVPNVITTTTTFGPGAAATYTGPVTGLPSWLSANHPPGTSVPAFPRERKRQEYSPTDEWPTLPPYPNVIKLEERRTPGTAQRFPSYCQQYQILWDGTANWKPDVNGNPIKFWLNEQDPNYAAYKSAGLAGRDTQEHKRHGSAVQGGCHCQWLSGGP